MFVKKNLFLLYSVFVSIILLVPSTVTPKVSDVVMDCTEWSLKQGWSCTKTCTRAVAGVTWDVTKAVAPYTLKGAGIGFVATVIAVAGVQGVRLVKRKLKEEMPRFFIREYRKVEAITNDLACARGRLHRMYKEHLFSTIMPKDPLIYEIQSAWAKGSFTVPGYKKTDNFVEDIRTIVALEKKELVNSFNDLYFPKSYKDFFFKCLSYATKKAEIDVPIFKHEDLSPDDYKKRDRFFEEMLKHENESGIFMLCDKLVDWFPPFWDCQCKVDLWWKITKRGHLLDAIDRLVSVNDFYKDDRDRENAVNLNHQHHNHNYSRIRK